MYAIRSYYVLFDDIPQRVFREYEKLEEIGLAAPQITYIMNKINKDLYPVSTEVKTIEEAKEEILRAMRLQND